MNGILVEAVASLVQLLSWQSLTVLHDADNSPGRWFFGGVLFLVLSLAKTQTSACWIFRCPLRKGQWNLWLQRKQSNVFNVSETDSLTSCLLSKMGFKFQFDLKTVTNTDQKQWHSCVSKFFSDSVFAAFSQNQHLTSVVQHEFKHPNRDISDFLDSRTYDWKCPNVLVMCSLDCLQELLWQVIARPFVFCSFNFLHVCWDRVVSTSLWFG